MKADILVFHIPDLIPDDPSPGDHGDGQGELADYEKAAETDAPRFGLGAARASLQGLNGLESRKIDGGIAAGGESDEQRQAEEHRNEPGQFAGAESQFDAGNRFEKGKSQLDENQAHYQGQQTGARRFPQELSDEVAAASPDNFSYSDFPGPPARPGRGQVHEVDAGDGQDDDGDGRENIDLENIAVAAEFPSQFGTEMDGGQRFKMEPDCSLDGL